MAIYIHRLKNWPNFTWDKERFAQVLTEARHRQGRLLGKMEELGFSLQAEANLHILTLNVLRSSEIEGEILNPDQVRSSIARRLCMDIGGLIPADRNVEGIVEMMLDATQHYTAALDHERLFDRHAAMFPTGRSGMQRIAVGVIAKMQRTIPCKSYPGPSARKRFFFKHRSQNCF